MESGFTPLLRRRLRGLSQPEGEALTCWVSTHGGGQDAGPVSGEAVLLGHQVGRGDGAGSFWKDGVCPACPGAWPAQPPVLSSGSQQVAAVSSVSPATPFQSVPPTVSQTPVIAATPVPTITTNVTSVPVPPTAAPPPPATPIIPVVPPTPPVIKVSVQGSSGFPDLDGGWRGWAGGDSAAAPGHRLCACRASGACDFWMFLARPVMQTRQPRLGGCRSHGWRGQAALEPQLLCPDTRALAVHGARWGRRARGGWEGPGPSCPAHTRIFSHQRGEGHRLPLHRVPLRVSTCTFISPLALLPLCLPARSSPPRLSPRPGTFHVGLPWPVWARRRCSARLGLSAAVPLPPSSRAATDMCHLLRFDPRSDPLGQAVFPHLTDEEAGAQRVNGSPQVTRSSVAP